MFENAEELMEAIEGRWGEEMQEQALAFAEEIGLVDQWLADDQAEHSGHYEQALEQEFQRVEAQIGRRLTEGEEQGMLDSLSTQNRHEGFVPDFTAEYGPELAAARDHESGRVHLGASAAQEVFDQQAAESAARQPTFAPPEPAGGGGRFGPTED
jgi:hypothetical protein